MHEMLGRLCVGWTFLVIVGVLVAFSASTAQAVTPAPTVGADRLIPPFGLPSWTLQGDAHITDKFVRIAEDRQHKKGALWNLTPNPHENWEATWTFRIHGVSQQGADGLAFWYVDRPNQPGTLFGSAEHFNGIAVVIDTYDNDGTGLHPYVMLLKNDGTKVYMQDHEHGSHKESQGTELDGCTMHIRNLATPSSVKVTYMNHMLKVDVSVEDTPWQKCIDLGPLDLPSGFHFGFSAATGDLADNHDLYSFSYHGLDDSGNEIPSPTRSQPGLSSPIAGISSAEIKSAVAAAVGPGLAQLQTEVSRLKQELSTLSERVVASEGRKLDNRPSDKEAHIASQVDRVSQTVQEVKQSIEKTEHGLKSKLNQLETALVSAGNGEEETGGSWLSWLTYLIVIATCVALFFFQYSAYRRRKQKFF